MFQRRKFEADLADELRTQPFEEWSGKLDRRRY